LHSSFQYCLSFQGCHQASQDQLVAKDKHVTKTDQLHSPAASQELC